MYENFGYYIKRKGVIQRVCHAWLNFGLAESNMARSQSLNMENVFPIFHNIPHLVCGIQ